MKDIEIDQISIPSSVGPLLDIAPIDQTEAPEWLALNERGHLLRVSTRHGVWNRIASAELVPEPDHDLWDNKTLRHRLHVSGCGRCAAIVNDYGKLGQIIDLQRAAVTATLSCGDYYPDTVPFSFAFVTVQDRVLAIHRTDWNRLDFTDPATGELLSQRSPTRYTRDETRPPHYLDYFHGALYVSPKNTWILSDGWGWHPVGIPVAWRLEDWCVSNVWESEDGSSKLDICARDGYWGHGICWIDEQRLAVSGIGDIDAENMIDGARIFDVTKRDAVSDNRYQDFRRSLEIATISGPKGLFFSDGESLFSIDEEGLFRWNASSGKNTGHLASFNPSGYHRGARTFAQIEDKALFSWTITDWVLVDQLDFGIAYRMHFAHLRPTPKKRKPPRRELERQVIVLRGVGDVKSVGDFF